MEIAIVAIVGIVVGILGGFFTGKYAMMKYVKENSTINEQMIVQMMTSMGQKPNQKKVNQIMKSMKKFS